MRLYIELFILGLPIAGLFALLATGVVMVYRASRILNLAQGGMAMFTAYILWWLTNAPNGPGLPVLLGTILALGFAAGLGWAMERFLLRPLRDRPMLVSVIMTVGALAFLTALAGSLWGYDRQDAPTILPSGSFTIGGITLTYDRLSILAISFVLMGVVIYLFKYTTLGIAMRAVSDDRRAALLQGVPADRVSTLTWVIGSMLSGAAGILLSPLIGLQPINLTLLSIPAYAAALFGGLTSLPLTLGGAAMVGLVFSEMQEIPLHIPGLRSFPGVRELTIFAIVILFLFFRWQALFGSHLQEEEI